jgi:2-octaprenyl-6-methoxyphenol hydroxylase
MDESFDIVIVGAGAAGLAAALALEPTGRRIAVVGRPDVGGSARTVALFDGSVRFLRSLGVWERVADKAAALRVMRIVDATDSLFRPAPAAFDSHEIGLDAFGWNLENRTLVVAMAELLRERGRVRLIEDLATSFSYDAQSALVRTQSGQTLRAQLVVGADGRGSRARESAGVVAQTWDYPQVAVTAFLAHDRPHDDISTEFHTREGPCTFVPLPGDAQAPDRSSLVWMMSRAQARRRIALAPEDFARELARVCQSFLGRMRLTGERGFVPMQGLQARRLTGLRLALVGEAAHVFPPIGAQGLNLGLRDAAHLAEALEAADAGADAGDARALARYEALRAGDVATRGFGVDLLNRALLSRTTASDALRGAGLAALSAFAPLRKLAMREGVLPQRGAPRAMLPQRAPENA